ncbi:MAG: hypothetical protein EBR82_51415 [Caulobacteraceae bacterium]|nr:hypothetical protein [Caulobacteraceae bacterium]
MSPTRQSLNPTTGTTQVTHILTPEAADRLDVLKQRLTEQNKGYFVSTSEVIRRAIFHYEEATRPHATTTKE